MNIIYTQNGIRIGRDATDKKIRKETTVIHHLRKMLNAQEGIGTWTRARPDRDGLTACRIGIKNDKRGLYYWHGNYQIEDAAEALNNGSLFLNKA